MKYYITWFVFAAIFVSPLCVEAQPKEPSKMTQEFAQGATMGDKFEVESSKLAIDRTKNTAVRQFAEMMIKDHSKSSEELRTKLESVHPSLLPPATLDEKNQKKLDELKAENGDKFDAAYIDAQTRAHNEAIELYSQYSKQGDVPLLKAFATDTLPVLQRHKEELEKMKD